MISYSFFQSDGKISNQDRDSIQELLFLLNPKTSQVDIKHIESLVKKTQILIARDEGQQSKIVGMGTLAVILTLTGGIGRIEDVAVASTYQGQGIGRMLIEKLLEKAKMSGLKQVDLASKPSRESANRLYQRVGFLRIDTNVYRLKFDSSK